MYHQASGHPVWQGQPSTGDDWQYLDTVQTSTTNLNTFRNHHKTVQILFLLYFIYLFYKLSYHFSSVPFNTLYINKLTNYCKYFHFHHCIFSVNILISCLHRCDTVKLVKQLSNILLEQRVMRVNQWSFRRISYQTSNSASSSKYHHLLVALVLRSSNVNHWPLLVALVLH